MRLTLAPTKSTGRFSVQMVFFLPNTSTKVNNEVTK